MILCSGLAAAVIGGCLFAINRYRMLTVSRYRMRSDYATKMSNRRTRTAERGPFGGEGLGMSGF